MEDANNRAAAAAAAAVTITTTASTNDTTTAYIRRPASTICTSAGSNVTSGQRPSSAPIDTSSSTAETTVTLPLRRPIKPPEDKGGFCENF